MASGEGGRADFQAINFRSLPGPIRNCVEERGENERREEKEERSVVGPPRVPDIAHITSNYGY
jgi:hypothetical protein